MKFDIEIAKHILEGRVSHFFFIFDLDPKLCNLEVEKYTLFLIFDYTYNSNEKELFENTAFIIWFLTQKFYILLGEYICDA